MDDYVIERVWPRADESTQQDVVAFWREETDLAEGMMLERSAQLVCVGRTSTGNVAAVSTAFPYYVAGLGFECFFVRALVGKQHRLRGLRRTLVIENLLVATFRTLNDRFQLGHDSDVLGVYLELENAKFRRRHRALVWSANDCRMMYLGPLPNGRQARVCYFDNAKVPLDRQ